MSYVSWTSEEIMGNSPTKIENGYAKVMEPSMINSSADSAANIITNHNFSNGLDSWQPNCCKGCIVRDASGGNFAEVTSRSQSWQGLEQDITAKITTNSTYKVSALVSISGLIVGLAYVLATLRLEFGSLTNYLFIGRTSVSSGRWEKLEGTFSLSTMSERVVFYIEGPSPGVNILIDSVEIKPSRLDESEILRNPVVVPVAVLETKVSLKLKLLVDTSRDRVVYAEAGKDFVDFLFNLLSLPIGTVIRIMSSESMVGSLGKIYESVVKLDDDCKEASEVALNALLKLSVSNDQRPSTKYPEDGSSMSKKHWHIFPPYDEHSFLNRGYVKGTMKYIVTDDLEVSPLSTITSIATLNKFNIKDLGMLEEKFLHVGMDEGAELLRASFKSKTVLTDVYLRKKATTVSVNEVD